MGCQCTAITNCQQDIGKVESIRSLLSRATGHGSNAELYLSSLARGASQALCSINSDEFSSALNKVNDPVDEKLPQLIQKCDTQISSLNSALSALRSEDRDYHNSLKE